MKKVTFFTLVLVFCMTLGALAVDSTATSTWKITADQTPQNFIKNDNATRSMVFNPATQHVLVATRTGGHRIVVLDAATGDSLSQLDMTGVSGGTYHLNKVAVTEDGVIYACNLTVDNTFKVYRWEDEDAVPTVALDGAVDGATRYGDAFAVFGTGTDTRIFISGNNANAKMTILTTENGTDFAVGTVVPGSGRSTDIDPIEPDRFWTTYPGGTVTLLDTLGALMGEIPGSTAASGASSVQSVETEYGSFLAIFDGNNNPATARLVNLGMGTDNAVPTVIYTDLGTNNNANGVGAVDVDPVTGNLFVLATNNSISALPYMPYVTWPLAWRVLADSADWFGTGHMVRTVAYSAATDHIYTVSRVGGSFVKVFDASTGEYLMDLDTEGISGGTYHINMVAATADGQIFVGNLALSGTAFKLYHYADESSSPVRVFDEQLEDRVGDALAVSGTGDDATVYVSGSGNAKIFTLTQEDSATFVRGDDIVLPEAGSAGLGIAPVGDGEYLFTNGAGVAPRYIKRDGTELYAFDTSVLAGTSISYFEVPTLDGQTHRFIGVVNGWSPGMHVAELLGDPGEDLCSAFDVLPAPTPKYATHSNANATGQAVFVSAHNTLVELITNNGMSGYSFDKIVPDWGTPQPEPVLLTEELDFGEHAVRQTTQLTVQLTNTGPADLMVNGLESDNDAFVPVPFFQPPVAVIPGDTLDIDVNFQPLEEGSFTGTLTILTDAGDLTVSLAGSAQEIWPLAWRVLADSADWFGTGHMVRTVAYSAATDHIYTVSRVGGSFVKVFDASTGEYLMDLDTEGISGGTYHINMVAATADGQIFVGNLALSGTAFKLYHYADESSSPVRVFDEQLEDRVGDALAVSGTGDDATVYVSGSGNAKIFTLTQEDSATFVRGDDIVLPEAGSAGLGIAPVGDGEYLFTNGAGVAPRYIKRDGTELYAFDTSVLAGTSISYFEVPTLDGQTHRFIGVVNGWSPGMHVAELLGDPGEDLCSAFDVLPAPTPKYATHSNANATGQAVFVSAHNMLVELITNNGMSAYHFGQVVPNPVLPTGSIIGTIVAAETGDPLSNAEIFLLDSPYTAMSDDRGEYGLVDIPVGTYMMMIRADDYFPVRQTVQVQEDSLAILNFELDLKLYTAMGVTSYPFGDQAVVEWQLERPDEKIYYHDRTPASGWFQKGNRGYGIVFDLSGYPDATVEQLDFCHYAWGVLHGPYDYRIHVYDWEDSTEIYTREGTTAHDSFDEPKWELAIDLGSIPGLTKVGVFVEPLSGTADDPYPALSTDNSVPAITGTSHIIFDITDPFASVEDVVDVNEGMGDFVMDLWINTPENGLEQIAMTQSAATSPAGIAERGRWTATPMALDPGDSELEQLNGFKVYRMADETPELLAELPADQLTYTDETPLPDSTVSYGVSALFALGESEIKWVEHYQPELLTIAQARIDEDTDFISDLIGDVVTVQGILNSNNYSPGDRSNFYLQDETAGINLYSRSIDFAEGKGLRPGDEVFVTGEVDQYRGLTEIVVSTMQGVQILSRDNPLVPEVLTLEEISETYEAQLVKIDFVSLLNPGDWPEEGSNGSVSITDGTDTLDIFIDQDTDLDGWTPPSGLFSVIGVVDQYTYSEPPNDGYDIRPRSREDIGPATGVEPEAEGLPTEFALGQNYPNPFNPGTSLQIHLPKDEHVRVAVYDVLGKQVAALVDDHMGAGVYTIDFDAAGLPSGTYFYRMQAGDFTSMKKMILLK